VTQPLPSAVVAVGIDLVDLDEIDASVAGHGERYLRRVYTDREYAYWERARDTRSRSGLKQLAACFAVKEATLKMLRQDDEVVPWRCIDVRPEAESDRLVELSGAGAELAHRRGIRCISGSVKVTPAHAFAVVFGGGGRQGVDKL
jgi:holo-[acyl-carrier protein] synthase